MDQLGDSGDSRAKIESGKDAGSRNSGAISATEDAARRRFAAANDALGIAFAYLNKRERTEAAIRARLEGAGCAPGEIDDAIDELRALGQVDDARFARLFAQDRRELDGWGRDRIARRLHELGVERELIGEVLGAEPEKELERAVELLGRRFPAGPGDVGDARLRERAMGVLIRKGYDSEVASDAVSRWTDRSP